MWYDKLSVHLFWHVNCMKVYRFGDNTFCYNIVIEEDSGEIRVAFVGVDKVMEYIATPTLLQNGITRLNFGAGSSMPYKNADGSLCTKYTVIYEEVE